MKREKRAAINAAAIRSQHPHEGPGTKLGLDQPQSVNTLSLAELRRQNIIPRSTASITEPNNHRADQTNNFHLTRYQLVGIYSVRSTIENCRYIQYSINKIVIPIAPEALASTLDSVSNKITWALDNQAILVLGHLATNIAIMHYNPQPQWPQAIVHSAAFALESLYMKTQQMIVENQETKAITTFTEFASQCGTQIGFVALSGFVMSATDIAAGGITNFWQVALRTTFSAVTTGLSCYTRSLEKTQEQGFFAKTTPYIIDGIVAFEMITHPIEFSDTKSLQIVNTAFNTLGAVVVTDQICKSAISTITYHFTDDSEITLGEIITHTDEL